MIFRQLFDPESSTYTYVIAERHGGEALIVDPVIERVEHYAKPIDALDPPRLIEVALPANRRCGLKMAA